MNLVNFALDEHVDVLLIAGDLYDGDWKDHNTGLFFTSQLVRLRDAGIHTYLISGNHDAANRMTRTLDLPRNPDGTSPLLSHSEPQTVVLDDFGLAIHGRGFGDQAEFDNLVDTYPSPLPGMLNIGMLHTSLSGAEGHVPYAPCSVEQLCRKGYSYWALGHVHCRAIYPENRRSNDPWIVFPGNLQGRHVRETGPKGCMLIQAMDDRIESVTFHALDVVRWAHVIVPMAEIDDDAQLQQAIREALVETLRQADGRLLCDSRHLSGRYADAQRAGRLR